MIAINEKANRSKLLAAVLAMVMIAVCCVVVLSDNSVNAEDESTSSQDIVWSDDNTTATVYTAQQMRDVLNGTEVGAEGTDVTTIIIGANFTANTSIDVPSTTTVTTIDGNSRTITALESEDFNPVFENAPSGGSKYVLNIMTSVTVENLTINNAGFAYGLNVYGSDAASVTVTLDNIASNNSAGAGFCFNSATIESTNLTASNYSWGGINADKGASMTIDALEGVGSIYTENSNDTATSITIGDDESSVVVPVEIQVGTKTDGNYNDSKGYFHGFYMNADEAFLAYAERNTSAVGIEATISVDSNVTLTDNAIPEDKDCVTLASNTTLDIGNNVTFTNETTIAVETDDVSGTISGGEVIATVNNMPSLEDGTIANVDGKGVYSAFSFRTNGYEIILGIITETYADDVNYAGVNPVDVIVLKAIDLSDPSKTTTGEAASINHITLDQIYQKATDAEENNGVYGNCTNAGNYTVRMELSISIPGITSFSRLVIAPFVVLPMDLNAGLIIIEGTVPDPQNEGQYLLPSKPYQDGAPVELEPGVDYNVYVLIDGQRILVDPSQYSANYTGNTVVGPASFTVTLEGNYKGTSNAAVFTIYQEIESITAALDSDSYYTGQYVEVTNVTGIQQNDSRETLYPYPEDESDVDPNRFYYNVDVEYAIDEDGDGKMTVTITYVGNPEVQCQIEVDVIAIESISVEDISENAEYAKEYDVNEELSTDNMKITVLYADGKSAIFEDSTSGAGTGLAMVTGGTDVLNPATYKLSVGFVFDPSEFDSQVGPVDVTVTYFGAETSFTVNVIGFAVNYVYDVDGVRYNYATQVGAEEEHKVVYNFSQASPVSGQSFTGWLVEGTSSTYMAGTTIVLGEDPVMWENTNTITLVAQFGTSTGGDNPPAEAANEILVSVVPSENGVNIYLIGLDGGYIPAGTGVATFYITYQTQSGTTTLIPVPLEYTVTEDMVGGSILVITVDLPAEYADYADSIAYAEATFGSFESQRIVY